MTEIVPSSELAELILSSAKKPVLIDVFADWCGPCRQIAPVIDKMSKDLADEVRIVKINRDEADQNGGANNPVLKLMAEKGVQGIPALLLFDGGEYKGSLVGGPRDRNNIQGWIEETLGRKFTAAAPPSPFKSYAIVLGPTPADNADKLKLAEAFLAASQGALLPVFERGDLTGEMGVAAISEGQELALIIKTTEQGAQDIADALPDRKVLDAAGTQVIPHTPGPS